VRTSAPSMAERRRSQDAFPRASPLPHLPAGLTIEKKKPGRKPLEANYHVPSSGNIIDRVEITKIPVTGSNGSSSTGGLDLSSRAGKDRGAEDDNAPLNLSMRSEDGDSGTKTFAPFPAASQAPSDYYASQVAVPPPAVTPVPSGAGQRVPGRADPAAATGLGAAVAPA
jgi:hypothetical protein